MSGTFDESTGVEEAVEDVLVVVVMVTDVESAGIGEGRVRRSSRQDGVLSLF